MIFGRVSHSMCSVGPDLVVMTGGSLDEDEGATCESFRLSKTRHRELPMMPLGRYFHSSCGFNMRMVFVFGGFETRSNFYLRTLDFLDMTKLQSGWQVLKIIHEQPIPLTAFL